MYAVVLKQSCKVHIFFKKHKPGKSSAKILFIVMYILVTADLILYTLTLMIPPLPFFKMHNDDQFIKMLVSELHSTPPKTAKEKRLGYGRLYAALR